jgi:GNAT superfamily N-acetyltransferase
MADASVRLARATDAPAIAAVQARAWRMDYIEAVPALVAGLDEPAMAAAWREAVVSPPTPGHRVVVALDGAAVVGLLAWGPAQDPDAGPDEVTVSVLAVDPAARAAGHGSRLLAAWADLSRQDGAVAASVWVPVADEAQRSFLQSAGWSPDSARRTLAAPDGSTLVQVRLVTDLGEDS